MAAILQTMISDAFQWMKSFVLWLIFLRSLPKGPIVNNPTFVIDNGLAPNRRQTITWTNADIIRWRIYVALGKDELSKSNLCSL